MRYHWPGAAAQAAHAVPHQRPPAGRGGDGPRGLLGERVDPLPPHLALPDPRSRRVRADLPRGGCPTPTSTATSRPAASGRRRHDHGPPLPDVEQRPRGLACRPAEESEAFYRNGEGDELIFVHEGSGELETVFGTLPYRQHDYIVIPRGPPTASGSRRRAADARPPHPGRDRDPEPLPEPLWPAARVGALLPPRPASAGGARDVHREQGDFD